VCSPQEVEDDDEEPKERTCPDRKKCQYREHANCQVRVTGEHGEAGWQIRAHHARKDCDEPEESEAVQSSDGGLGFDPVHRLEPWQDVGAKAKQARDIAQDPLYPEYDLRRHLASYVD